MILGVMVTIPTSSVAITSNSRKYVQYQAGTSRDHGHIRVKLSPVASDCQSYTRESLPYREGASRSRLKSSAAHHWYAPDGAGGHVGLLWMSSLRRSPAGTVSRSVNVNRAAGRAAVSSPNLPPGHRCLCQALARPRCRIQADPHCRYRRPAATTRWLATASGRSTCFSHGTSPSSWR